MIKSPVSGSCEHGYEHYCLMFLYRLTQTRSVGNTQIVLFIYCHYMFRPLFRASSGE
jgi:hypothetical protein